MSSAMRHSILLSRVLGSAGGYASPFAARADAAFRMTALLSMALLVAFVLAFVVVWFGPAKHPPSPPRPRNGTFAIALVAWSLGMLGVVSVYFWLGLGPLLDAAVAPDGAFEIRATSSSGTWLFEYPNGETSLGELAVPRWQPVRLVLGSTDLLHEFSLPEYRVRETAIPGRYTSLWFLPNRAISTRIECATFCPDGRDRVASLSVLETRRFDEWLSAKGKTPKKNSKKEGQ